MADGMARMIQMLATLSQIQTNKREMTLKEQQFEEAKKQMATSMGMQEKSQQFKNVMDLLDKGATGSTEAAQAYAALLQVAGAPENLIPQLTQAMITAPRTLEQLRTRAANTGYNNAGTQGQAQMNAEAASGAVAGMNQGQVASSGLQSVLAGGAQRTLQEFPQMGPQQFMSFLTRAVSGQTPGQAAVDQQIASNPAFARRGADIQTGGIAPAQAANIGIAQGNLEVARRQVEVAARGVDADFFRTNAGMIANAQEMAGRLASARQVGGPSQGDITNTITELRNLVVAAGKEKNEANRTYLTTLFNYSMQMLPGMQGQVARTPMEMSSILERLQSTFRPPGMTTPPIFPNTLTPPGAPQANPLSPFIRP